MAFEWVLGSCLLGRFKTVFGELFRSCGNTFGRSRGLGLRRCEQWSALCSVFVLAAALGVKKWRSCTWHSSVNQETLDRPLSVFCLVSAKPSYVDPVAFVLRPSAAALIPGRNWGPIHRLLPLRVEVEVLLGVDNDCADSVVYVVNCGCKGA